MLNIAFDVAQGLSHIHGKQMLHRDVWSANILVTGNCKYLELLAMSDSHDPLAKITSKKDDIADVLLRVRKFLILTTLFFSAPIVDFGLSECVADNHNSQRENLRYIAPEIYYRQTPTTKSDIYSYAITIYELFTRSQPYQHLSSTDAAWMVAVDNLRPLLEWNIPCFSFILVKASLSLHVRLE